jgi:hypothetical protein
MSINVDIACLLACLLACLSAVLVVIVVIVFVFMGGKCDVFFPVVLVLHVSC